MIAVSDKFLEIVNSNVRPSIKPVITVTGKDANGNNVSLTWKSNNIIDMSYKRGIDPTGQTLPYMELTWKEFYFGKLNAQNFPEKYENVVKYMKVELSFTQQITKINTWGDFKSKLWGNLKNSTWGQLFRSDNSETVKLPAMILVAKPTIQGHTITWTARDALSFFNERIKKSFKNGIPASNAIKWLFLNERGNFLSSEEIITFTSNSLSSADEIAETLNEIVVFDGSTKDLLKNFAKTFIFYWNFATTSQGYTYAKMNSFVAVSVWSSFYQPVFKFKHNIMKSYPEIIQGKNISSFSLTRHFWELDEQSKYTLLPAENLQYTDSFGNVLDYYKYIYKGLGISTLESDIIGADAYNLNANEIVVTPVVEMTATETVNNNKIGEPYIEDNPLQYLPMADNWSSNRTFCLDAWYSENKCDMIINSLHNVAIEPGDFVEVETNLYDGENQITKKGVVLSIELTYNGKLDQKTVVHEVD